MKDYEACGIIGVVIGVLGLGYGLYRGKKSNDLADKLDRAIDGIASRTPVEIQDDIIRRAAKKAVEDKVDSAVSRAVNGLSNQMHSDISTMLRRDVSKVYDTVKDSMKDLAMKEVRAIDYGKLQKDVITEAGNQMVANLIKKSAIGKLIEDDDNEEDENWRIPPDTSDVSDILRQFSFDSDKIKALKTIYGRGED